MRHKSLKDYFDCKHLGAPAFVLPHPHEDVFLSIQREKSRPLHCSIRGDPHPTYRWYQGNVSQLANGNEQVLCNEIDYNFTPHAQDAPGTNYTLTCLAENNRGAKRQVFHLQLQENDV